MRSWALTAFVCWLSIAAADLTAVSQHLHAIEAAVIDLHQQLQQTDMGYTTAFGIHQAASALTTTIQHGTRDVDALPAAVSVEDTRSLLDTLRGLENHVRATAQQLVVVKPAFDGLGVISLARRDVAAVRTGTASFGAALVAKAAPPFTDEAKALADAFNEHLQAAANVYGVGGDTKDEL